MYIIGAGLSGCIAGVLNPEALILEAGKRRVAHAAVLRFRGPQIGQALGIPFHEVKVFKSIFMDHQHYQVATPAMMNWYSAKVTRGQITERSIGDTRTVQRWVAPDNFHEQMLNRIGDRVLFEAPVQRIAKDGVWTIHAKHPDARHERKPGEPVISTMPLPLLAKILGIEVDAQFNYAPIRVMKWYVPNCNVHQTVYFPAPDTPLYRATLTGGTLIAESMELDSESEQEIGLRVDEAFGLTKREWRTTQSQEYGKIQPIDTALRKQVLYRFTSQHGVFSLGRFALWSNILLDDVFEDLAKIRAMISLMSNGYDLLRSHAHES